MRGVVGQKAQPQIAVFLLEALHTLGRDLTESIKRHRLQMAILIFAVKHHAGGLAAHTGIKALHSFGLYIYIIAVIKGKCQRIFIVFAPVHQSVHFFGGHGVGIQALSQPGFHLRAVGTDKIIRLHTAQQLGGQRPAAAPRGHSQLYACRLHGVQGIGHRAGDPFLPGGANRAVKIKNQQLILHVLCSLSRYFTFPAASAQGRWQRPCPTKAP